MQLFQLLHAVDDQLVPERCKLHLAGWDGEVDPLEEYLAGRFDEWQPGQSNRNFQRDYVVSLIALPRASNWLFVGAYESLGCKGPDQRGFFRYDLRKRESTKELDGRLVVWFERPGRQSYLLCEKWDQALRVAEIRPDKLRVAEFPGYSWAMLTKQHLDIVVRQHIESWRVALSNVAGVYVIADRHTGNLYVGSANSGEGIWSRWCDYSATGHGGNRELRELLRKEGDTYAENFQFGILEIADTHASTQDVLDRESYWKGLLLTREHGYNAN